MNLKSGQGPESLPLALRVKSEDETSADLAMPGGIGLT